MSEAAPHKNSQLRGNRKRLSPRYGVWDDQIGFGGVQGTCASQSSRTHLLGQQHGSVWQFVGIWAGLLPHWDLLGQKVFSLREHRQGCGNKYRKKARLEEERLTVNTGKGIFIQYYPSISSPYKCFSVCILDHCPLCSFDDVLRG